MGSAFWHGSETDLGITFDNNTISVISYIAYQIGISSLNATNPVVVGLRDDITSISGIELAE